MKTINILAVSLLLSGCVSGDCTKDCDIIIETDIERKHKCDIDPYRTDCPVRTGSTPKRGYRR